MWRFQQSDIKKLAEMHITNTGKTVLGHYDPVTGGYIAKAQRINASYFDIGKAWDLLSPAERKAANIHFLDIIAERGDQVYLSVPKYQIRPNSSLSFEIDYLIKFKGYVWVNQWSLIKK